MARRLPQTLADYLVIAVSPALIMAMVGSLLFFLLTAFYHGQYETRLTFIFAMFTLAVVLIARISMEEGIEYASLFGIPMAIVTGLAMIRFVAIQGPLAPLSPVINFALLALAWWSAHRLTWDCTYIDDRLDASGEGLLQGMGFDGETVAWQVGQTDGRAESAPTAPDPPAAKDLSGWWQRMVQRRRRPHTPGVWVVYYALAALPLFGVGHWLIPTHDSASRLYAFRLICVYVASALGLLLTTSFLGLRRYLRQRHTQMQTEMATIWLTAGTAMILGVMLACVVLPRPGASLSISQLPFGFGSPGPPRTHRRALGGDGPQDPDRATQTQPDRRPGETTSPENAPPGESSVAPDSPDQESAAPEAKRSAGEPGKSGTDAKSPGRTGDSQDRGKSPTNRPSRKSDSAREADSPGDRKSSDAPPDREPADDRQPDGEQPSPSDSQTQRETAISDRTQPERSDVDTRSVGEQERPQSQNSTASSAKSRSSSPSRSPASPPSFTFSGVLDSLLQWLGNLSKILLLVGLIAVIGYFAWKYRDRVRAALDQLWQDLKHLWDRLFGQHGPPAAEPNAAAGVTGPPPRPFASYTDPFTTGSADRYGTDQLVLYTFEALEAWAREHACPRQREQTPFEFSYQIAFRYPELARDTQSLADLYSRIVYGNQPIPADRRKQLQRLWQGLRTKGTEGTEGAKGTEGTEGTEGT